MVILIFLIFNCLFLAKNSTFSYSINTSYLLIWMFLYLLCPHIFISGSYFLSFFFFSGWLGFPLSTWKELELNSTLIGTSKWHLFQMFFAFQIYSSKDRWLTPLDIKIVIEICALKWWWDGEKLNINTINVNSIILILPNIIKYNIIWYIII